MGKYTHTHTITRSLVPCHGVSEGPSSTSLGLGTANFPADSRGSQQPHETASAVMSSRRGAGSCHFPPPPPPSSHCCVRDLRINNEEQVARKLDKGSVHSHRPMRRSQRCSNPRRDSSMPHQSPTCVLPYMAKGVGSLRLQA